MTVFALFYLIITKKETNTFILSIFKMKKLKLRELSNPIHKAVEGQAGV